jgi:phospho-N-acetylmuramoyl-pentapeptide-transferase
MSLLLGLLIFSFTVTSVLIVPFIGLLYKLRFQRQEQVTLDTSGKRAKVFDRFHHSKAGVPIGGGLLVIMVVSLLFGLLFPLLRTAGIYITNIHPLRQEIFIIFFTFISFGLLGLYDDILKFFQIDRRQFAGLRLRHKFGIQWILAFTSAFLIYNQLQIQIVNIPFVGVFDIGWFFVPVAAFIIVSFANAVNITDGLDGLASGALMIALFSLWVISSSILDTPLSVFIALWLGSLIAFLYFNVFPARIIMGDVGALSFGATIAVIGLLLGKIMALTLIGGLFVVEIMTSLLQILSKKYGRRKIFAVAPFHLWLQLKGWEEPKIVMRAWLASIMFAVFGLWLAFM